MKAFISKRPNWTIRELNTIYSFTIIESIFNSFLKNHLRFLRSFTIAKAKVKNNTLYFLTQILFL